MPRECRRCGTQPNHGTSWWAGLLLIGVGLELMALRRGQREHTLSHVTRSTFHTHTRPGQFAFTIGWGLLSGWFVRHIVSSPHNKRPSAILMGRD